MDAVVGCQPRTVARSDSRDDARLIGLIAEGDRSAFETLFRSYHPRLTRFLINMIHRSQIVEEVLNDTMLVVWNRSDTYNGTSKVSTWIFAIAYRKALNALRRQDEPMEDRHMETLESAEPGPEQLFGQRQVQEALWSAMSELSADHRAVLDLAYFHEIGYREIAEIMGCPADTVKTRMYYARRHLKRRLAGPPADWF